MTASWAVVTGASAGLGREFARQLAADGYSIVVVARREEPLQELAAEIRNTWDVQAEVLVADLLEDDDRERVARRLESTAQPVGVLVNNAGWGVAGNFSTVSWADEKDHLDIHVTIPLELSHRVIPGMRERGGGRVIVVSSVAAFLSRGAYSAAKRYWVTMAKSLTATFRTEGITVTAVCPGLTRTEFHQRMGMDVGRVPALAWLSAKRVVADGLRDSSRGKAVSIPSWRYRLVAALAPLIPARLHRLPGE